MIYVYRVYIYIIVCTYHTWLQKILRENISIFPPSHAHTYLIIKKIVFPRNSPGGKLFYPEPSQGMCGADGSICFECSINCMIAKRLLNIVSPFYAISMINPPLAYLNQTPNLPRSVRNFPLTAPLGFQRPIPYRRHTYVHTYLLVQVKILK